VRNQLKAMNTQELRKRKPFASKNALTLSSRIALEHDILSCKRRRDVALKMKKRRSEIIEYIGSKFIPKLFSSSSLPERKPRILKDSTSRLL
jgi:hypothetical protein